MYIVFLPDGNTKECHTQRSATREVRKWNVKNLNRKTCSMWAVRQVIPKKLKMEKEPGMLERFLNCLLGRYDA